MATKQLDFIASTPVWKRKPVMPRIRCKDGVSLSVQASSQHYSPTKANPGITRGDDEGPWYALEVGFVLGASIPSEWPFVENHYTALRKHDRTGVPDDIVNPVYCVDIDKLRAFIESHGGEAGDLHAEILALRKKVDEKYVEFQRAQEKERGIWDFQIAELFGLVPEGCNQIEAEKVFLEKYAASYDAALKDSHRLYDEWIALVNQCDALMKQERAELERELENAGK